MSAGTLYTTMTASPGARIMAVAALGDVDIKLVDGFEYGVTQKTPEYRAKFPQGKAPGLETPSGFRLTETAAILRYVARLSKNSKLLGTTLEEDAQVEQWCSFTTMEVIEPSYTLMTMLIGQIPYSKQGEQWYLDKIDRSLNYLEGHLHKQTYLVGERITMADVNLGGFLKWMVSDLIDPKRRAELPNTMRFMETVVNHSKLKPVFGEIVYCEKSKQYTPPAKVKK